MKKILLILSFFLLSSTSTFAATEQDQNAASFLAEKNIIATSSDYKLDSTITRREMLKVMMNLSGKPIASTCSGKFRDLSSSDWGCKYAEAALANGYISANTNFRPNDSVTNIEALKMVMQAKGLEQNYSMDWRDGYRDMAKDIGLISAGEFSFTNNIQRKDVFHISSKSLVYIEGTTIYGIYNHCYPAGGPVACIDDPTYIDGQKYTGNIVFNLRFIKPGTKVEARIYTKRDDLYCNNSEGMCISGFHRDYEVVVGDTQEILENVFDSCGSPSSYETTSWYKNLDEINMNTLNEMKEICYSQSLGLIIGGGNSDATNTGYPAFYKLWLDTNTHFETFDLGSSNASFGAFGKRDGNIIPITIKSETGIMEQIYFDFVLGNISQ